MRLFKTMAERKAYVAQLNVVDDVFFNKIVEDPEVCEEILRVILNMPTLRVIKLEVQRFIRNVGTKSVILDVLCQDDTGKLMNMEMQKANDDDHIKRVRYYAANLDTLAAEKGKEYHELPDLYMVYITRKDFLQGKKVIYHVERRLAETGKVVYNGVNEIYVNTAIYDGTNLAELMRLFTNSSYYDPKFPKTSARIRYFKEENEGVNIMCDLVANEIKKAVAESEVQIAQYKAKAAQSEAKAVQSEAKAAESEAKAVQYKARAMQAEAENERLKKELEKLRAKA